MEKQLFIDSEPPTYERFLFATNQEYDHNNKPKGGLWTSTWLADEQRSDWVAWCVSEEFGRPYEARWFLLTPSPEARIYTIDSRADLIALLSTYGREGSAYAWNHTWIDWEALSEDYDAVHLTKQGNSILHWGEPDLNCWDVESTVWLNWVIASVEEITVPVREASGEEVGLF